MDKDYEEEVGAYYKVSYNKELFKFGALFYVKPFDICMGLEETWGGRRLDVLGSSNTIVIREDDGIIASHVCDPLIDYMFLPVWAWEILHPKPVTLSTYKFYIFNGKQQYAIEDAYTGGECYTL